MLSRLKGKQKAESGLCPSSPFVTWSGGTAPQSSLAPSRNCHNKLKMLVHGGKVEMGLGSLFGDSLN